MESENPEIKRLIEQMHKDLATYETGVKQNYLDLKNMKEELGVTKTNLQNGNLSIEDAIKDAEANIGSMLPLSAYQLKADAKQASAAIVLGIETAYEGSVNAHALQVETLANIYQTAGYSLEEGPKAEILKQRREEAEQLKL